MTDTAAKTVIEAAADRLEALADAAPDGDWERGGFGDFGWAVHLGDLSVETEDSEAGAALADYLELVDPRFSRTVAALLRLVAGATTPNADARDTALQLATMINARPPWADRE
ncbi:hypothetical protein ABT039_22305 [Streptomyces lasiicapitis]|uniref:hypothetical protein n=1 Tax=Streptomyces lasiicapitis TaxID=1923961 RepID=UPI003320B84C